MTYGITSGQVAQLTQLAESAARKTVAKLVEKMNPSKEELQRVLENGGQFQSDISPAMGSAISRHLCPDEYADEEVDTNSTYPPSYRTRELADQIDRLTELFPKFRNSDPERLLRIREEEELPIGSDRNGWYAIPHWASVGETYEKAVERVFDMIRFAHGERFINFRERRLGESHMRETERKARAMHAMRQKQNSDILVFPAQLGFRHRGRSVRRARAVMGRHEFGLGAYETGVFLLTHPERFQTKDDLWMKCAGDEYVIGLEGTFHCAPIWRFHDGQLRFSASRIEMHDRESGSVTGFVV